MDEYWDKLVKAGATPTQCGWIKDVRSLLADCPATVHGADR
ncbi:MAG: VOC family protein [Candidatus Krumholzibacteria bacterium]|nr:VOC family protein [Candidatus Krumholzibacteria bacterium]